MTVHGGSWIPPWSCKSILNQRTLPSINKWASFTSAQRWHASRWLRNGHVCGEHLIMWTSFPIKLSNSWYVINSFPRVSSTFCCAIFNVIFKVLNSTPTQVISCLGVRHLALVTSRPRHISKVVSRQQVVDTSLSAPAKLSRYTYIMAPRAWMRP